MFYMPLAYIDPGSGTILLQFVIGSIVGAGLFFRQSIARLFGVLRRRGKHSATDPQSTVGESMSE